MAAVVYAKMDLLLSAVTKRGADFFIRGDHLDKCKYLEFLLREHPDMVAFGIPTVVEADENDS